MPRARGSSRAVWPLSLIHSKPGSIGSWEKTLKVGGQEVKDRMISEAGNNALVASLFMTISMPSFMSPPDGIDGLSHQGYMLLWMFTICSQFLSLISSVHIIAALNKLGSDEAILEFVREIRSKTCGVSLGNFTFFISQLSAYTTALAVASTGFWHYGWFPSLWALGMVVATLLIGGVFMLRIRVAEEDASFSAGDIDENGQVVSSKVPGMQAATGAELA
jgi:hypothetical protein